MQKIGKNCSGHKVSYKYSSNYYHFSASGNKDIQVSSYLKQGVFAVFSVCERLYFSRTSCEIRQ